MNEDSGLFEFGKNDLQIIIKPVYEDFSVNLDGEFITIFWILIMRKFKVSSFLNFLVNLILQCNRCTFNIRLV